MPRDNTKIKPEVLWAVWSPHQGFMFILAFTRRLATVEAQAISGIHWSKLKASGWQAVKVIVTPFNWEVMQAADKAQGVKR